MTMLLEQLTESTREERNREGADYSPTNSLLSAQDKLGNLSRFGVKRRLSTKGSKLVSDDKETGDRKAQESVGQLLFHIAAFADENGWPLEECVKAAQDRVEAKRAQTS